MRATKKAGIRHALICCALLFGAQASHGMHLLVDFGPSAGPDTYGLAGWETTISDGYTENVDVGPGGMTITTDSNESYNYQGVTGTTMTFAEGVKVTVTWFNDEAEEIIFTPKISFDDPDRRVSSTDGTWYDMSETTIAAGGTGTSEFEFDAASAGNYEVVNVNCNYSNSETLICDKIEVSNQSPTAAISVSSAEVLVDVDPGLDGSGSTDADGTIQSYEWDFDYDGTNFDVQATGAKPSRTYSTPGTYTAALRVTDDNDAANIATVEVVVWADEDSDGLPDWWEERYLGTLDYGPSDDPDDDGLTNEEEYGLGTHPGNDDSDGDGIPDGVDPDPAHAPEPFAGGCGGAPALALAALFFVRMRMRRTG